MTKRNIDHLTTSEKLIALAEVLETQINPQRFNMTLYVTDNKVSLDVLGSNVDPAVDMNDHADFCGSAACAIGVAACAFEGLEIRGDTVVLSNNDSYLCGFDAAEQFFGISSQDAMALFSSFSYPRNNARFIGGISIEQVAQRLRAFAAGNKEIDL